MKTAKVEEQKIQLFVRAAASIFPHAQANIAARITAPIRELLARKGDSVRAGQTLAVLESRDVSAQQEEATASVADAQANLQKTESGTLPSDIERARGQVQTSEAAYNQAREIANKREELFKLGAIPERELLLSRTEMATTKTNYEVAKRSLELLEKQSGGRDIKIAQSRLAQAQARLKNLEAQLAYTRLDSPFSGTVTDQFAYPGDMAKPDTPTFIVMDLSTAVARAQVPEADAGTIRLGQSCAFQSADNAGAQYQGRVSVVNRAVDPARRTVETWCEIAKPPQTMRAGLFGEVRILTTTSPGLVVPQPAVQLSEGTQTGWVMTVDDKNTAHRREIQAGQTIDGKVQILKGLKPGERVVVQGAYGLPDGTEVKEEPIGKE